MNKKKSPDKEAAPARSKPSLLERAAQVYDFSRALEQRSGEIKQAGDAAGPVSKAQPPAQREQDIAPAVAPTPAKPVEATTAKAEEPVSKAASRIKKGAVKLSQPKGRVAKIDRDRLEREGYVVPGGAVTSTAEEFRIVKRRLLKNVDDDGLEYNQRILICSAQPGEGKTFCALNLAISMAAEKDREVLLVDADFAKPSVLSFLGIDSGPGLMDALVDPSKDVDDMIIYTDVPSLAILPAGTRTNVDTEYLASSHACKVLARLTDDYPGRIVIFDSPPLLAASPASELASQVGQALMVVRAEKTGEKTLHDALDLLTGCDRIQLLLNAVQYSGTGRSFGAYYGYGEE